MYYQLTPHKSTTMGFSVAFECLQSFLHAFLNANTYFKALQPSQSGLTEIGQILKFLLFSIPTSSISMMHPNIDVMCIVKFQYATSAMLALPYDHFLVSLLFLDVLITVIVPSLFLTSFLNVFIVFILCIYICTRPTLVIPIYIYTYVHMYQTQICVHYRCTYLSLTNLSMMSLLWTSTISTELNFLRSFLDSCDLT